jgi:HNH endonuclease
MSRRRGRRKQGKAFALLCTAPIPASVCFWWWLGKPLHYGWWLGKPQHYYTLGLIGAVGLITAIAMPAVLLSIQDLPKALVPASWRTRYRRGAERSEQRSSYIPKWLRRAVLAADQYRCVWCHKQEMLSVDHIRPWSKGGLAVFWNLMVLCSACNTLKSNCWVARDGYEFYRAFEGSDDQDQALAMLRFERRHRWRPGRWVRAGWDLAA